MGMPMEGQENTKNSGKREYILRLKLVHNVFPNDVKLSFQFGDLDTTWKKKEIVNLLCCP